MFVIVVVVVDEEVYPFDQFYQYTSQQFVDDHHSIEYCLTWNEEMIQDRVKALELRNEFLIAYLKNIFISHLTINIRRRCRGHFR